MWVQGVGRMFPGTVGGQSRVVTPVSKRLVVPRRRRAPHEVELFELVFDFTGAVQNFHVPLTLTPWNLQAVPSIEVNMNGGGWGGGAITAEMPFTPGETVGIYVGEAAGEARQAGGWNGGGDGGADGGAGPGGGGGGASDIRRGGTGLGDRIIVAGGSGGYGTSGYPGATPDGSDGYGNFGVGTGATQSAGGTGVSPGTDGSLGQGGVGGDGDALNFGGSGGGGGYYGGGGVDIGGPAGGGSSWEDGSGLNVFYGHITFPGGAQPDGQVSLNFFA